jgi:hypothetical protein
MRAWVRDHRLAIGGVLLAFAVAAVIGVLLAITSNTNRLATENARQDEIDRARTEQLEEITDQLADVITQLDEERQVSCAYGNGLRRSIREFIADSTTNPVLIARTNTQFADRTCPSIPTPIPTTVPTEEP